MLKFSKSRYQYIKGHKMFLGLVLFKTTNTTHLPTDFLLSKQFTDFFLQNLEETLQELPMLSTSVTINCQVTNKDCHEFRFSIV